MKYLLLLMWCLLFGNALFAQDITKDTVKLKEVKVTGVKIPEKDKSDVPMQSISRTELNRISGNNVADAIKNFSGITLKDYGGIGGLKTVMVRSLDANHTGVFIDNVQVSDAATGQIDLGKISTDNAESVSLFIGQPQKICLPAKFYVSASVINIQSEEPDFRDKSYWIKARFKVGSFGLINPIFAIQNKISKTVYTDFLANYTKANGDYPYHLNNNSSIARRHNSDIESLLLNGNIGVFLPNDFSLNMKLYYYGSERGLPGAVIESNPYAEQRLWNNDFFTNIQLKNNPGRKMQWLTNLKFSQNKLHYLNPGYHNTDEKLENHYVQHEYYISQAIVYKPIDSLSLSVASDFFINTLDANLYQYARPTRYSSLSALAFTYSVKRFELNGNALLTVVREKTQEGVAAKPRNKLSPTLFLGYKLTNYPTIAIRLLYKDIFRMPTFNDLYYTLFGNNNLTPEYAKQYNLGFTAYHRKWIFDYISLKTDIFYNQVTDKIVAIPKSSLIWSMRNIGRVDIRGMELQTNLKTRKLSNISYSASCNYTYQEATDITNPESKTYNKQIPYVPFETFSTLVSANYHSFTITSNAIFSGYQYVLGDNNKSEINMVGSWWTNDLTFLYEWNIKKTTILMKSEISNVFGKQYDIIKSFPMPGRAYSFSINLTF